MLSYVRENVRFVVYYLFPGPALTLTVDTVD